MNLVHQEFMRCIDQQNPIGKVRADMDEAICLVIQQTPSSLHIYKDHYALFQGMNTGGQLMDAFAELTSGEGTKIAKFNLERRSK